MISCTDNSSMQAKLRAWLEAIVDASIAVVPPAREKCDGSDTTTMSCNVCCIIGALDGISPNLRCIAGITAAHHTSTIHNQRRNPSPGAPFRPQFRMPLYQPFFTFFTALLLILETAGSTLSLLGLQRAISTDETDDCIILHTKQPRLLD